MGRFDAKRGAAAALLILAVAALAAFLLLGEQAATDAPTAGISYEPIPIPIAERQMFELGVTDYDHDGLSDLFTTNHAQASSLLHNLGGGEFSEEISASGLHQDEDFPGLADVSEPPSFELPGLYVFAAPGGRYELEWFGELDPGVHVRGVLQLSAEVRIPERIGADVSVERNRRPDHTITTVRFELRKPGSRLVVNPPFLDVPVTATIDDSVPIESIFVGSQAVTPPARTFVMRIPDRHGIAFADLDGDSQSDAWVISGGNRARIDEFRGLIQDELFYQQDARFVDRREQVGIRKGLCRGRTAEAVDYDGDQDLDLFESCADTAPKLYRQDGDGQFENASEALGGGSRVQGSEYRWLDLTGDRRAELVVARRSAFAVLSYDDATNAFRELYQVKRPPGSGPVRRLVTADFDNDGDADLFAAATGASAVLLVNDDGRLRPRDPRTLGLPRKSVAAAWVDYDNDGRTDLHLIPQGIYRQVRGGRFVPTGRARLPEAVGAYVATAWFDLENDGDRDLLAGFKSGPEAERKSERTSERTVEVFRSAGARGHWLDVDLEGAPPNTDAIGAEVRLDLGGKRLTGFVGQSDSTRHSRGDHRLYFGLGKSSLVPRLTVRWPDGSRTSLRDVPADQVLRITR